MLFKKKHRDESTIQYVVICYNHKFSARNNGFDGCNGIAAIMLCDSNMFVVLIGTNPILSLSLSPSPYLTLSINKNTTI